VVVGDDRVLEQVRKQLEKIVTVVRVDDVSAEEHVERDLMLLKVNAPPGGQRSEIRELVDIFRGRIVDVGHDEIMIEISGRESKIEAFIERMRPYGIRELVRTGRIAMVRGRNNEQASTGGPRLHDELHSQIFEVEKEQITMAATIYYDNDADLSLLKNKTIAILGYGSQGHAQAQNLKDSGCNVIIGQRPGGPNYDLAVSHGFDPLPVEEATKRGDLVNILLPDEVQGDIYRNQIRQISARQHLDVFARL